ncbi:DUF4242 domain-containing protein [Salisediminibacterium halotolerans]|uniref:DUF4242 domain-containing protein n=1 Tax=Salisediminibacterium halotolerans TaxID=517425 RepID=A0A1H9U997_9BACI|nr:MULTISPECIES: DUF4242 domain-containing protein [Salisediminibacterium]RLJ75649.1 uncharacterized protein DUF4242 [Actinophytocola xinjiangensis]RPE89503.1 uncharacterized protein DUF4242 [Salisediminibacterium halotolerans]TWG36262.1 uncharacterized protein DUF4242 [Salisediminibacterium halotolerans]SES06036.1 Protein of unknown function [Salisediminibacterium haloalkalitolerans]GEL07392.1 hypothetical protein SHA02_08080 [Salisediminibacterium halotolerans]
MGLYLIETDVQADVQTQGAFEQAVEDVEKNLADAAFIEVQVAADLKRAFFIFETEETEPVTKALNASGLPASLVKEVRIVGQELEEAKKEREKINYLVEWNLPEDLTMDQYLERKKKNSVHYAEVPEVSFSRTYVCEDMSKCLCFYDAPDDDSVLRAREAVKAPVDEITKLSDKSADK